MGGSNFSREKVQWLHDAATEFGSTKMKMTMDPDEVLALTGALLAAMDSEPVAYISKADFDAGYPHILARRDFNKACTMPVYAAPQPAVDRESGCKERKLFCSTDTARMRKMISASAGTEAVQLYRYAQPAPVVADEIPDDLLSQLLGKWDEFEISENIVTDIWKACRAAMLNQAPVKQPSSNGKSELLQRAEKLAEDTAALVERVHCENLRAKVRAEHAEWATKTFGNTGPVGPLKHLSAEALEAAAAPHDLSEWADMQFLFWDAQRKAGVTDEQITAAMVEKLEINKGRQWPEPKDGEPRFHIK